MFTLTYGPARQTEKDVPFASVYMPGLYDIFSAISAEIWKTTFKDFGSLFR